MLVLAMVTAAGEAVDVGVRVVMRPAAKDVEVAEAAEVEAAVDTQTPWTAHRGRGGPPRPRSPSGQLRSGPHAVGSRSLHASQWRPQEQTKSPQRFQKSLHSCRCRLCTFSNQSPHPGEWSSGLCEWLVEPLRPIASYACTMRWIEAPSTLVPRGLA